MVFFTSTLESELSLSDDDGSTTFFFLETSLDATFLDVFSASFFDLFLVFSRLCFLDGGSELESLELATTGCFFYCIKSLFFNNQYFILARHFLS